MTAPRRSGAEQATIRGAVVLLVAVVVGLGLLSKSNGLVGDAGAGASKPTSTTATTTSTTAPPGTEAPINNGGGTTGTTATTHPAAQVKVVVVNAGEGLVG